MSIELDDFLRFAQNELGEKIWIPLYKNLNKKDKTEDGTIYSSLVAHSDIDKAMSKCVWDLAQGSGGPSIVISGSKVWYESFTSNFRPLVFYREFHGLRKSYRELSQELVLFLNLFHDCENNKYVVDDDYGVEIDVIKYSSNEIVIRKSFLEAFMSAKQMDLLLFFEITRHKNGVKSYGDERVLNEKIILTRYWGDSYVNGFDTFNRVRGKKIFHCRELTEENTSPFSSEKKYQDFIIDGDVPDYRDLARTMHR